MPQNLSLYAALAPHWGQKRICHIYFDPLTKFMSTIVFYLLNELHGKKVYKHVHISPGRQGIKKDSLNNFEPVPSFVPLLLPLGSLHQSGSFSDEPSNACRGAREPYLPPTGSCTSPLPHLRSRLRATTDQESA